MECKAMFPLCFLNVLISFIRAFNCLCSHQQHNQQKLNKKTSSKVSSHTKASKTDVLIWAPLLVLTLILLAFLLCLMEIYRHKQKAFYTNAMEKSMFLHLCLALDIRDPSQAQYSLPTESCLYHQRIARLCLLPSKCMSVSSTKSWT